MPLDLTTMLDALPGDNIAILQAAKALVSAIAGVLLALGIVVSPALLTALPFAIAAAYGLYRAVKDQQAGRVAAAAAAPALAATDTPK
jgi:hypothetical protein